MTGKRGKIMGLMGFLALSTLLAILFVYLPANQKTPVILIIIDTFPVDHSSAYGYARQTTPNLEALSRDGVKFLNAIAPSPWTLPSVASILTGHYPSRHLAGFHLDPETVVFRTLGRLSSNSTTMAEMFKLHDYQTAAIVNNLFFYQSFGLDRGFDNYNYAGGTNIEMRDCFKTTAEATDWLKLNLQNPFFLVVHYFDPHLAYNPPPKYAAPFFESGSDADKIPFDPAPDDVRSGNIRPAEDGKRIIKAIFDGEIAATDDAVGRLLQFLKDNSLYDETLIVVTADHGEEFWEHGGYEHGHSMHREVVEVPLIIKFPENEMGGLEVRDRVSLTDIMPTVSAVLDWSAPDADGTALYPLDSPLPSRPIISENNHYGPQLQGIYIENFKTIVQPESGQRDWYDLSLDPWELSRLATEVVPPDIEIEADLVEARMNEVLRRELPNIIGLKPAGKKLRSLGYIK